MFQSPNIGMDIGTCFFRALSDRDRRQLQSGRVEVALKSQRILKNDQVASNRPLPQSLPRTPATGSGNGQEEIFIQIIRHLMDQVEEPRNVLRPRVFIALRDSRFPALAQPLQEAAMAAGAADVQVLPASLVASSAVGYGPSGIFLGLDMGWAQSDLVLRDRDHVLTRTAIPIAGQSFDDAIRRGLARDMGLFVDSDTLFKLKSQALRTAPSSDTLLLIAGRTLAHGIPDRASIESDKVRAWIEPEIDRLTEALVRFIHQIPAPQSHFLQTDGLWIYGGTARMEGLPQALAKRLAMPVHQAQDPSRVLLRGLGRILSKI